MSRAPRQVVRHQVVRQRRVHGCPRCDAMLQDVHAAQRLLAAAITRLGGEARFTRDEVRGLAGAELTITPVGDDWTVTMAKGSAA